MLNDNMLQIEKKGLKIKTPPFKIIKEFCKNYELYLMLLIVTAYFVIFHYLPLYGIQIAFKDFIARKGIWGSPWVGFKHFERFFRSYYFRRLIGNTVGIRVTELIVSFPIPILLALSLNEVKNIIFKKTVQNVTYIPHFLSNVVVVGMVYSLISAPTSIINQINKLFGLEVVNYLYEPQFFKPLYIGSNIWANMGWSSILYMAALTSIDKTLYEAAYIDGASKLKRIVSITIQCIAPTIIIVFLLNLGRIMNIGFEKIYLMQNELNLSASDVISTYVYRSGIIGAQYSFSTAVELFNAIINFLMLVAANKISKKVSEIGLW